MVSARLIQLIEDHWEAIAQRMLSNARNAPELERFNSLPDSEIREWATATVKNLGSWLVSRDVDVSQRYEEVGRAARQRGVPLHECVWASAVLKNVVIDYLRDHGIASTAVEIYAEEDLEFRVNRFFDRMLYYLAKGYESEPRPAPGLSRAATHSASGVRMFRPWIGGS